MQDQITAARSGTFPIGGKVAINRLGFGTMRMTGPGVWGTPPERAEALRTLRRLPALDVNFIDTADSYGPDVAEPLLREALHPYSGLLIATKAGLARTGPDQWVPLGRPEYLIQQAHKSCRNLGIERLGLWQLHRIDPKVPRDEQFGAVKALLDDDVIEFAGLSEVSIEDIEAARKVFPVTTVQNRYNVLERDAEDVLQYCEDHDIGFIPWFPLGSGNLVKPGSLVDGIAQRRRAAPGQIALAWLLRRSRVMLPIAGTSKVAHLEENIAAAGIELTDAEFFALDTGRNVDFPRD